MAELYIGDVDGGRIYRPAVEEGITWSTERRSTPGKLTFKVLKDDIADFTEGSAVRFEAEGRKLFFGYVFKQQRTEEQIITVTAYDQLRYLKNKDTRVYTDKTASGLIQMIADDYQLRTGVIEDSGFIIESRIEENTSLFEMIENALDLTIQNRKEMYGNSYLMIDEQTGQSYDYTSSIDDNTYNKVKLTYDNEDSGYRDVYIAQDSSNINRWGVLQYFDTLTEGENGQVKADCLLELYNKKTRNLKISNAIGDSRVRAGSMVAVHLNLGDVTVKNFMLVEKVTHTYKESEHWMDLTLRGGEFVA